MMSALRGTVLGAALALTIAGTAGAQSGVEMRTTPQPGPRLEIAPQGPATREATRPSEADFYKDDVRVRHEPAFIEPFVTTTRGGNEVGASAWTAPATPVGSLASQGYQQSNGWLGFGITFVFNYPPKGAPRPTSPPR
jgi:hypothetical protein